MNDAMRDHYDHPRNIGALDRQSPRVGTGIVVSPVSGDVFKIQIEVDEKGTIEKSRFKTFGCGTAIACSSLLTEMLEGSTLEEAAAIEEGELVVAFDVQPLKRHLPPLAIQAVAAALDDYHAKHPELTGALADRSRSAKAALASIDPEKVVRFFYAGVSLFAAERAKVLAALDDPTPGYVFSDHYESALYAQALEGIRAAKETGGVLDQRASCALADLVARTGELLGEVHGPIEIGDTLGRQLAEKILPALVGEASAGALRGGYAGFKGSGMYELGHLPMAALLGRTFTPPGGDDDDWDWGEQLASLLGRASQSKERAGQDLVFLPHWMVVLGPARPGEGAGGIQGRIPGAEIPKQHVDYVKLQPPRA